jgi:hypothetical protein
MIRGDENKMKKREKIKKVGPMFWRGKLRTSRDEVRRGKLEKYAK